MAEDTSTGNESQNPNANAGGQQADDSKTGADTQAASKSTEGQQQQQQTQKDEPEKKFTQADLDRIVKERLSRDVKKGVRDELKKLTGEKDDAPTVESVTKERDDAARRADEVTAKLRIYEAAEQVEEFVADKRNAVHVRNMRGLLKMIRSDYQFDDEGKVTNLKELIADAKRDAPELFGVNAGSIDGGKGNGQLPGQSMNDFIRAAAGR